MHGIGRYRYEGWDLATKFGWMQRGEGPAAAFDPRAEIDHLAQQLADSDTHLNRAMGELRIGWEGAAAGAATTSLACYADQARSTSTAGSAGSVTVESYGGSFTALRPKLVAPVAEGENSVAGLLADGARGAASVFAPGSGPMLAAAGLQSDYTKRLMANKAADEAANAALYAHENEVRTVLAGFPSPGPGPAEPGAGAPAAGGPAGGGVAPGGGLAGGGLAGGAPGGVVVGGSVAGAGRRPGRASGGAPPHSGPSAGGARTHPGAATAGARTHPGAPGGTGPDLAGSTQTSAAGAGQIPAAGAGQTPAPSPVGYGPPPGPAAGSNAGVPAPVGPPVRPSPAQTPPGWTGGYGGGSGGGSGGGYGAGRSEGPPPAPRTGSGFPEPRATGWAGAGAPEPGRPGASGVAPMVGAGAPGGPGKERRNCTYIPTDEPFRVEFDDVVPSVITGTGLPDPQGYR